MNSDTNFDQSEKIGSYATLIDQHERFVTSLGRVVGSGDTLKIKDGSLLKFYRKRALEDAAAKENLRLVFLPPDLRLTRAPRQVRDGLYMDMARSRIDGNS
jgi:hypothetical protein